MGSFRLILSRGGGQDLGGVPSDVFFAHLWECRPTPLLLGLFWCPSIPGWTKYHRSPEARAPVADPA
jgi:hypothetical protein